MTTPNYPTWDRAADYEIAAVEHVEQMRAAITDNQPGTVVEHIDGVLKALHRLREAAVSEHRRQQDDLMARLDARYGRLKASPAGSREEVTS